jgi:hypothetical protein
MENGKWKMENGKWKMENGKIATYVAIFPFSIFPSVFIHPFYPLSCLDYISID